MRLVLGILRKQSKNMLEESTAATRSFVEMMLTAVTSNSKEQGLLPLSCFPISILCSICQNPPARKLVGREET